MNNIAKIRKARGLSQGELAEMAEVKQPHISRLENGDYGVTVRVVYRIAEAFDLPVAALFSDERTESENILIDAFNSLPKARRDGWLEMARLAQAEAQAAGQEASQNADREDS